MAAGSKIAVEITASSATLQEAASKAAASLKDLAKVVADTSASTGKAGDSIIAKNRAIADSFTSTWKMADKSSSTIKGAYVEMGKAATTGAATVTRANEEIAATTTKAADTSAKSAEKIGLGFGVAGSSITRAGKTISEGLLAIGAAGIYMAAKFQQATTQFNTQAGASVAQTAKLKQGILDMAGAVGQTPDQLAGGMYHIVSSLNNLIPVSRRTTVELAILKDAAEGAAIGGSNMTETTYALSGAMNALSQTTVPQAQQTMAQLNAIVGAGDMHMQDLVSAMSTGILPAARTFGISLQSVGAALDVMTDSGIPAEQAATRLRMGLTMMAAPTKMATSILKDLGLTSQQAISSEQSMASVLEKAGVSTTQLASDLRMPEGILVALQDLKVHLEAAGLSAEGASAVIARAFGGARSGTAIEALFNNLEKLRQKYTQLQTTTDNWGQDWARTQNTMVFQWHQLEAATQAFLVEIGTGLMPVLEGAISVLKTMVDWLGKNKTVADALGVAIGVALATAVASFAYVKAVAFVSALGKMLGAVKALANWLTGGMIPALRTTAAKVETEDAAMIAANDGVKASFLAWLGPIGLVAGAVALLAPKLNSLSNQLHSITGGALGNGLNVPAGLNLTPGQAQAMAQQAVTYEQQHYQGTPFAKSFTAAQYVAALKAAGDITGGGTGSNAAAGVTGGVGAGGGSALVSRWAAQVAQYARGTGIPVSVLLGQIQQESGGNPSAVSSAGAFGLTQFTPGTAAQYGVMPGTSAAATSSQLRGQATYMAQLFRQYGSVTKALEAYYGGAGGVANPNEAVSGGPTPAQYAASILSNAQLYSAYGTAPRAATPGAPGTPGVPTVAQARQQQETATSVAAKSAPTSQHFNPFTQRYEMMTAVRYRQLENQWLAYSHGKVAMPSSPAALVKADETLGLSTALTVPTLAQNKATLLKLQEAYLPKPGEAKPQADWYTLQNQNMGAAEQIATKYQLAQAKLVGTDVTAGGKLAASMQSTISGGSTSALVTAVNATHATALANLVAKLTSLHSSAADKMVSTLASTWNKLTKTEQAAVMAGGSTELGTLTGTLSTGTDAQIIAAVSNTQQTAMQKVVNNLSTIHTQAADKMITAVQSAWAALKQAAVGAKLWTDLSAANTKATTDISRLGSLGTAATALGIATPAQVAAMQETPIVGAGLAGGNLTGSLTTLIQALIGGGGELSTGQAKMFGGMFGGQLGANLQAIGTGTMSAADTESSYDAVYSLIDSLNSLNNTVTDSTLATQQMVNLLQQQNTNLSEELRLSNSQTGVLQGMIPQIPHFAEGGPVVNDGLAFVHAGEHVVPRGGTLLHGTSPPQPVIHIHNRIDGNIKPLIEMIDSRVVHPANTGAISNRLGARSTQLQGAPGGFRGYNGFMR